MRRILFLCFLTLSATPLRAETFRLICENQRREYAMVFDDETRSLKAGDTDYRVLAVERHDDRFIVVGLTVDQGPTFRLHLSPYRKIEFFIGNQLFQTDGCR